MKEKNFNEIAENIIYNFLTDPNVDEKIEKLKQIPMTCSHCHIKGLQQVSKPRFKQYPIMGKLTEVELIDYICPNCRQRWVKYKYTRHNFRSGGGIIEKELSYFN